LRREQNTGIGFAGVALAFGLTVVTMAYAVGDISGKDFNPAVTVGLCVGGRTPTSHLVPYVSRTAKAFTRGEPLVTALARTG
jgi:glycerol uptake facilitator-like aquaporin